MGPDEVSQLLDEIDSLLREPGSRGPAAVARIEQTLTDGYARALELEAETWRLERRIVDVARLVTAGDGAGHEDELSRLYGRLAEAEADAKRLRGTLASLRRHADDVRAA